MFGVKDWNIQELTGYVPITTYYTDFGVAEIYGGEKEVRALYRRAFKFHHEDIKWMTELCMVLNWKIHEHYGHNDSLAKVYNDLWEELDSWILECEDENAEDIKYKHFTKDEISYFVRMVD